MLIIKTKLKEVDGKGIGLFADQEIKKSQSVWAFNSIIDIKINKKDIPEDAKEFFHIYAIDNGENNFYLNTDNARFINHSENPNIKSLGPLKNNIVIRDIHIGEEITIDYNEIDINGANF